MLEVKDLSYTAGNRDAGKASPLSEMRTDAKGIVAGSINRSAK